MTIPCDIIEIADKYIKLRSEKKNDNNENALFLSLQGTRMTSRAIEKMVRKYGEIAIPTVNLSPQILRDTFGSMLYKKSGGNLYVVAEALGVRDINTVRRRYSKLDITEANIPHVIKV